MGATYDEVCGRTTWSPYYNYYGVMERYADDKYEAIARQQHHQTLQNALVAGSEGLVQGRLQKGAK